jgi:hypothetical protein
MLRFVLFFALLVVPAAPTLAQDGSAPLPATPAAPTTEKGWYGRSYLLVGGALPRFGPLTDALRATAYPALGPGALVIGAGGGTARPGRVNLGFEIRAALRGHRDGVARPRTYLSTVALTVPLRYEVVRHPGFGLEVLAGPQVQLLDLALRGGADSTATFGSYVSTGQATGARRLTRAVYGLMGGVELTWRLPRVWTDAKDGGTSQVAVGLRVQATLPVAWARWRTQRTGTGRNGTQTTVADQPLAGGPRFNPEGLSAALVVSGLFAPGTGAK